MVKRIALGFLLSGGMAVAAAAQEGAQPPPAQLKLKPGEVRIIAVNTI